MERLSTTAGVRDSELTNHGVHQAQRLGQHFKASNISFTHMFSSPLKRAAKTADLVREAQGALGARHQDADSESASPLLVKRVAELIEQDFGFYEGKSFYERTREPKISGKQAHMEAHNGQPGFVPPESAESMASRGDRFLDEHLLPLLHMEDCSDEAVVAIVSHGILLKNLWRCLLRRLPTKSVELAPEISASQTFVDLEHLGSWSNTGYLELDFVKKSSLPPTPSDVLDTRTDEVPVFPDQGAISATVAIDTITYSDSSNALLFSIPVTSTPPDGPSANSTQASKILGGYNTTIRTINGRAHLKALKRTGGGVGSAKFEEGQKTIETFFKRPKLG
ncbi:MAG: hypothetical protein M1820_003860 [Bogoriella megaspora]|nr:MAG: hypothetical protein M1820_003860 [Bogoriella megaspora]